MKGGQLDRVIDRFIASKGCPFGTMATRIHSDAELIDPNTVKVAVSLKGDALWFSRYPIPFLQRATATARSAQFNFRRHIGVYLFRNRGLRLFASWPRTNLERAESLEQLRMLEHGMRVQVFDVKMKSVSVDSPSDIEKLERVYR